MPFLILNLTINHNSRVLHGKKIIDEMGQVDESRIDYIVASLCDPAERVGE